MQYNTFVLFCFVCRKFGTRGSITGSFTSLIAQALMSLVRPKQYAIQHLDLKNTRTPPFSGAGIPIKKAFLFPIFGAPRGQMSDGYDDVVIIIEMKIGEAFPPSSTTFLSFSLSFSSEKSLCI